MFTVGSPSVREYAIMGDKRHTGRPDTGCASMQDLVACMQETVRKPETTANKTGKRFSLEPLFGEDILVYWGNMMMHHCQL